MTRFLLLLTGVLAALVFCAGAQAYVTVGQIAPPSPESYCNLGPTDTIQLATEGGGDIYAVPDPGLLTSWSTSAGPGAGQAVSLKVYRPVAGSTYSVVAQDGPRALTPSVVNTFPIDIPVEAGDVIGLNDGNAAAFHDACSFFTNLPGDKESGLPGEAAAGSLLNFEPVDTEPNVRVNVSATLQTLLVAEPVTPVPTPSQPVASPSGPPAATPPPGSVALPAQCLVPRLGAKKLAVAKKLLAGADCKLGRVTKLKGATVKSGLVVSQNPQTGKKLAAGAKVAVKLAVPNA